MQCPHCGAELANALGCAHCGRLLDPPAELSPFELLGLPERYRLDGAELRQRVLRAGRLVHPDFFTQAPAAERELAERNSARLNRAHELLSDDWSRADWLLCARGGPAENEQRSMPPAFLAEVLEWNELLEEARGAPADPSLQARLETLARTLAEQRAASMAALAALLEPLPERGAPRLAHVRTQLNVIRYVDRALTEIEALSLARASLR
jgi:DnaJ-domain-containing protein 1